MSRFATLALDLEPPRALLTLSRPDRLNALSPQMLSELIEAAEQVGGDSAIKVVTVRGAGRAFSAGFDLDAAADGPVSERADLGRQMADAVGQIPAVTIAAIHGHCVGGALVLAAACDIRIATPDTRFAIPEIDFGIPLAWGGIPRLVRELGPALTKELVITCRPFSADEARAARFLNRVVAEDELDSEVEALAASLAAKPAFLIRQTKRHVDALVEEAYSTGESFRDAAVTVAALQDAESRAAASRYLEARGRSTDGR
jgi:enoyl-CoA hydratase/carnithine racemase